MLLTILLNYAIIISTKQKEVVYMWRVYNEFGEIYTESYNRSDAERSAEQINGYCRHEDTADCNPYYDYEL